jgi:hypothetical protein
VLQAIRAWTGDVDHLHDPGAGDGPPRTRAEELKEQDARNGIGWDGQNPPWQRDKTPAQDMADAIAGICGGYLSGRAAEAGNPDTYQVIIHAGGGAITGSADPGVPAETPPVSHPAHPARCHVEDGPALSPATAQTIACTATISAMIHDASGTVLSVGRRTRRPPAALRRAARERDSYHCRFPGCESRRVDLHHVVFWANGGQTKLANLVCLGKRHHTVVHDKGIIIAAASGGFAFYLRDGTLISSSPPLPASSPAGIATCHTAVITPSTIIPPHSGERLDLHLAIWTCFANAKNQAARREREQALAS